LLDHENQMNILVTFAVDAEFAPWRSLRVFKRELINSKHWSGGAEIHSARIGDHCVWVFLTGIGIQTFDFALASCFEDAGANVAVSSGLAGSLKAEYAPPDIIVPLRVGSLKDVGGPPVAAGLLLLAKRQGAKVVDVLLTADHVVDTREEKQRLALFADTVDMESRHVMSSFIELNLPVATIRAISDSSEEDLPVDFAKCLTPQGRIRKGALLKELIEHPAKVSDLVRFGRQSRNAAKQLVAFLDGFVEALTPEILHDHAIEVTAP
jgi:adenosylhomocysteine nucleosidase